ncbi:hypothetical protein [Anaerotalea alkaliphila]|uniref:Uncharacterized protein n=1 Tax=Anaerotalea alkaliphila TaxID=2662126 RepID=A0A7X5HTT8_9FIRM|nr:hypothetical protein [Anaerotalea alkaliphila]NDL66531.1 hypothetical protein [Anaerotalea alkaliphila]
MFKMPVEEFKAEIAVEMSGYEDITQALAQDWLNRLEAYIAEKRDGKGKIVEEDGERMVVLEDESELFGIVDKYLLAIEDGALEEYWQGWEL